ncbi:MAG: NINE protein [Flavobacteriales bacterium]
MSEDNKENLGDDLKDKAKETVKDVKETAKEMKEDAKEFAKEAKETAKNTVDDIKEGWNQATNNGENKKVLAGILAIVLGSFGVHKFYLGYNKEGMILAGATIIGYVTLCIGVGAFVLMATGIVGLIEGIIYLTKSDDEFYQTYQANKKPWF